MLKEVALMMLQGALRAPGLGASMTMPLLKVVQRGNRIIG